MPPACVIWICQARCDPAEHCAPPSTSGCSRRVRRALPHPSLARARPAPRIPPSRALKKELSRALCSDADSLAALHRRRPYARAFPPRVNQRSAPNRGKAKNDLASSPRLQPILRLRAPVPKREERVSAHYKRQLIKYVMAARRQARRAFRPSSPTWASRTERRRSRNVFVFHLLRVTRSRRVARGWPSES